jgi:PhnB protein
MPSRLRERALSVSLPALGGFVFCAHELKEKLMNQNVSAIPAGRAGISPYLTVSGAAAAIAFYEKVFDARELFRLDAPDGRIGHAELMISGTWVMISDEYPEMQVYGPQTLGSPVTLHLYVADVDAVVERALAAGATLLRPVADQFYGDRGGKLRDPFGHQWWLATHTEDVSPQQMRERAQKLFGAG